MSRVARSTSGSGPVTFTEVDPKPRFEVIDAARGLIIILVVLNHVVNGLRASTLMTKEHWLYEVNSQLYLSRMPALALILGLFMAAGVAKGGTRAYIRRRVEFGIYIYAVWYVISGLSEVVSSRVKNVPKDPADLLQIWIMPGVLWFLPYLAVAAIVVAPLAPWRSRQRLLVTAAILVPVTVVSWGWNPDVFGLRGLALLVFTAAGAAIGFRRLGHSLDTHWRAWTVAGLVAGAAAVTLYSDHLNPSTVDVSARGDLVPEFTWADRPPSMLVACLGVVCFLGVSVLLHRWRVTARPLVFAGRHTLEIFVVHTIVTAATRIALEKLGITDLTVHIVAGMLLGVLLPLFLAVLAPRLRLTWLFAVPARGNQTWRTNSARRG